MSHGSHVFDYDLICIGSGAGGGVAAHIAARQGKKVAIIEDDTVGGECPNYGCIPTKALLHAAELYRNAKAAKEFGIRMSTLNFNYTKIKQWKDMAVHRTGTHEGARAYANDGIAVIKGHAHFVSPHEISTGQRRYKAKHFLIATGAHDFIPPIEGLHDTGFLTYREAIDLSRPLKKVFVIGGGAIGCELSELFATFGAHVTIAEYAPHLLPREDIEVGELVQAIFEQMHGMEIHVGTKVTKVEKKGGKKVVHFEKKGIGHMQTVDEILVAAGKVPRTDIGLENAGVTYSHRGIKTNLYMQTTAKHIFAAGDVTGPFMFTHMASYQSRIAIHNMYEKNRRKRVQADYHAVTRCVFTTPEVASVGMTEDEVKEKGWKYRVGTVPIAVIGRANTTNQDVGFVKVLANGHGVLVGASIVAPRAGEMIHELALAIQHGMRALDIAETIHAFPTWSEAVRIACAKVS